MSHYANYLIEKTDCSIVETEEGFATYRFTDDRAIYIVDIYVSSDFRKSGVASKFADRIAEIGRGKGLSKMYGSINLGTKDCTASLKVLLAYGFQLNSCTNNFLLLDKEI